MLRVEIVHFRTYLIVRVRILVKRVGMDAFGVHQIRHAFSVRLAVLRKLFNRHLLVKQLTIEQGIA